MNTFNRLIFARIFALLPAYFFVAYLSNFHASGFGVFLLSLLAHTLTPLGMYYLAGKARGGVSTFTVVYAALMLFIPAMYYMAKPFTNLFDPAVFHLENEQWIWFVAAFIPAYPLTLWAFSRVSQSRIKKNRLFKFVDDNLHGLLAALFFFCVYLIFASIFNRPSYDMDDIFFDADSRLYRWRYATENYRDYYWRPAHPFLLIIVRPLVGILAFLFGGDTLFAAFTLNALVGAACVFLVWYFMRTSIGNPRYALLIAALFGASSSQLVFGSVIESYIYLAAIALLFLVLLLKESPLGILAVTGLLAFGVTISNIAQTFIAHFFVKRNIKQIVVYGIIVGTLVFPLTWLNNVIYPNAHPYFWDLSHLEAEGHNQFAPTVQRANYFARVMFLHSVVAPEPLLIDDEFHFNKTWMFRAAIKRDPMRIAQYETWFDTSVVLVWVILAALGGLLFLKNIRKHDIGFPLTFIVTILFYFALHMTYGKDVFLYSANWTYAIILFLALAWRELAEKCWFQIALLVFVLLLLANNSQLLFAMLENSAPAVTTPIWR
jgi:hypothetical protein